jgi:pSer/pThr/pTyr-binding forkhead associated (FHA) protein
VFKKLFGRKDTPKKDGTDNFSTKVEGTRWVKKFSLELTNMEGVPSYSLSHQLTIGSEVGNIVISDPTVSPRHCTFLLQEDVVSVIDHASVAGTLVNGKKIPTGRYIILEESDSILVGDLEVKIQAKSESVQEEVSHEEPEQEVQSADDQNMSDGEEVKEMSESTREIKIPKTSKFAFLKNIFKRKAKEAPQKTVNGKKELLAKVQKNKKKGTVSIAGNSSYSTNTLVRLFAIFCDFLIAYSLLVMLNPFDEFRSFVSDVPGLLSDLFQIDWTGLWASINEDYPFVGEVVKDIHSLFSNSPSFGILIFLFISVRLLSTLLLGVSISEAALGVRSHGNAIWKRIGGGVRVLLGVITGPFIIFDVPAIVSRRTFKEFMTFTHTYLTSKFFAIIGLLLYLPLVLCLALLSPLFQGFELPEPILISDRPEKRIKVAEQKVTTEEATKLIEMSQFLNLEMTYDSKNVALIPLFKFSGQKKKMTYKSSLIFLQKEIHRSVQFEVLKTFDLKELLGLGIRNNFLLYDKFPEIYNFVYSSEATNSSFKAKNDAKANKKFADEVMSFTKISFSLSADNAVEYMESYSPWLKGLMDYRLSLLSLLEYKDFDKIDFVKIGNAYFLRASYNRQKPFDIIIPIVKGEGRVMKIEYDKKENLGLLSNQFYKYTLNESNWFPAHQLPPDGETLKPFQVLDFFSKLKMKDEVIGQDKAQALYGYYYEKSAEVLKAGDPLENELWKKSIESIFSIMEKMKESFSKKESNAETASPAEAGEEDPRLKLFQNFQDLKDAFENKNREFFNVEESASV